MRAMMLPVVLRHPWEPFLAANLDLDFVTDHYYYNNANFYNIAAFLAASGATFTRASGAWYEDSTGQLSLFSAGVPRRGDRGLLIEEARTNIALYCNDFTQAAWTKTALTVAAGTGSSPDGAANNASILSADGTSAYHNVSQSLAVSGTQYVLSIYAAPAANGILHIQVGGANIYAQFDLNSGALLFSSAGTGTLTDTGSTKSVQNWRRYYMVFTQTSGSTQPIQICPLATSQNAASPSETSSASIYVFGADLEAGAWMSAFIATVTTAITRQADVFSIPSAAFYNSPGQSVLDISQYEVITATTAQVSNLWMLSDGSNNNRIGVLKGIGLATLGYRHVVAGTGSNPASSAAVLVKNTFAKVGYSASAANDFSSINGVTSSTAAQTAMPAVTTLYIGQDQTGSYQNGYKSRLALFPVALTQDSLNALTT